MVKLYIYCILYCITVCSICSIYSIITMVNKWNESCQLFFMSSHWTFQFVGNILFLLWWHFLYLTICPSEYLILLFCSWVSYLCKNKRFLYSALTPSKYPSKFNFFKNCYVWFRVLRWQMCQTSALLWVLSL